MTTDQIPHTAGRLTDTHCHLNSPLFDGRIEEVLARAAAAQVTMVVVPGWDRESSLGALELAATYPAVLPAAGLHPWFVAQHPEIDWLPGLLDDTRIVAVGEIGLDAVPDSDPALQEAVFRAQLRLAAARDLPVLVHCRRGWDRLLACLREEGPVRGIMHAFSGSRETLDHCLAIGLYISFGGMVTRPNSLRARAAAAHVPADRLLLETDAPYMALDGVAAEDAEPKDVATVLKVVAELRGDDPALLAGRITENVRRLFRSYTR